MGFFDSVIYSTAEHQLTEIEVRRLVTYLHIPSLKGESEREKMVQNAILARRHSDGKVSLQQIYELLNTLKNQNTISKFVRDETMNALKVYYSEHFPAIT